MPVVAAVVVADAAPVVWWLQLVLGLVVAGVLAFVGLYVWPGR